jgi:hypothetical protein
MRKIIGVIFQDEEGNLTTINVTEVGQELTRGQRDQRQAKTIAENWLRTANGAEVDVRDPRLIEEFRAAGLSRRTISSAFTHHVNVTRLAVRVGRGVYKWNAAPRVVRQ